MPCFLVFYTLLLRIHFVCGNPADINFLQKGFAFASARKQAVPPTLKPLCPSRVPHLTGQSRVRPTLPRRASRHSAKTDDGSADGAAFALQQLHAPSNPSHLGYLPYLLVSLARAADSICFKLASIQSFFRSKRACQPM